MAAGRLVYYNGEFVPESEAKVSVFDSALMFGDMVFDMTRSFGGKQFVLSEHIDRIYAGIKMLRIPLKMTPRADDRGGREDHRGQPARLRSERRTPHHDRRVARAAGDVRAGFRRKDRADRNHQRFSGAMDRRAAWCRSIVRAYMPSFPASG